MGQPDGVGQPSDKRDTNAMTSATFENVKVAKVNGTTLAYCEQGEGEPVLFVHGAVADLRFWGNQLPVVGRSYRAISYSQRYSRPNEEIDPDAANRWDPHVDDLAVFLREIGAAPAHLRERTCLVQQLPHLAAQQLLLFAGSKVHDPG